MCYYRKGFMVMPIKIFCLLLVSVPFGLIYWEKPTLAEDRLGSPNLVSVGKPEDQAIQETIMAAFSKIKPMRGLRAQALDGVVVLRGSTSSFGSAEDAVTLASRLKGVLYVVDEIHIDTSVDSYLALGWKKIRQAIDQALSYAPLLGISALTLLFFYLAGRLATSWDWPYRRIGKRILLQNVVRQSIKYMFVFAGLLLALDILGLTVLLGAFVGVAGVIGLALGFAFKDIAENYVAGFLISIQSPFGFMDWIGVDQHQGSVVRVTSRELVIMNLEGNHVRIPNSLVFKSVIYNYTRNPLRRFDIDLGVGVEEDLQRVQGIGVSVLQAMKGVAEDPGPTMRNLEFGDSAMMVRFSGWVDQGTADFLKVRSEAIRILKEALDAAAISVPVPIQQVISVEAQSMNQTAKPEADRYEELREDAQRADVERDSHLDQQIEKDRREAKEVDLLVES